MFNVVVDVRKLSDLRCGLGQYALHLVNELKKTKGIGFYTDTGLDKITGENTLFFKKWHRYPFVFKPNSKIWHSIHQDAKVFPRGVKKVLTIHDLNHIYENPEKSKVKKYLSKLQKRINQSEAVTFISEFTKSEVSKHLDLSNKKTFVIHNGVCVDESIGLERPDELNFEEYFFSIGTVVEKKNFKVLIDLAKDNPNQNFVLAGSVFNDYGREVLEASKAIPNFTLLDRVSDSQRLWLLKNSKALIHPSFLEGFGLPIIESYHYSKPVICSNVCSLPEVAGEHATFFDPSNIEDIKEKFKLFLKRFPLSEEEKGSIKAYADKFSWENATKKYLAVYEEIS